MEAVAAAGMRARTASVVVRVLRIVVPLGPPQRPWGGSLPSLLQPLLLPEDQAPILRVLLENSNPGVDLRREARVDAAQPLELGHRAGVAEPGDALEDGLAHR